MGTVRRGPVQSARAFLLATHEHGTLRDVGRVGSGFDTRTIVALYERFQRPYPLHDRARRPPAGERTTLLRPSLVARISYREMTADHRLRQPAYLGLRDDKSADDVVLPKPVAPPRP